ncbi:hypothetical protein ON010_g14997 [Phytophthora cinnamomi]|nr:hypothetical protein ON010_g14997 [Phytophthora cinnamomi]
MLVESHPCGLVRCIEAPSSQVVARAHGDAPFLLQHQLVDVASSVAHALVVRPKRLTQEQEHAVVVLEHRARRKLAGGISKGNGDLQAKLQAELDRFGCTSVPFEMSYVVQTESISF